MRGCHHQELEPLPYHQRKGGGGGLLLKSTIISFVLLTLSKRLVSLHSLQAVLLPICRFGIVGDEPHDCGVASIVDDVISLVPLLLVFKVAVGLYGFCCSESQRSQLHIEVLSLRECSLFARVRGMIVLKAELKSINSIHAYVFLFSKNRQNQMDGTCSGIICGVLLPVGILTWVQYVWDGGIDVSFD